MLLRSIADALRSKATARLLDATELTIQAQAAGLDAVADELAGQALAALADARRLDAAADAVCA